MLTAFTNCRRNVIFRSFEQLLATYSVGKGADRDNPLDHVVTSTNVTVLLACSSGIRLDECGKKPLEAGLVSIQSPFPHRIRNVIPWAEHFPSVYVPKFQSMQNQFILPANPEVIPVDNQ